MRVAAVDTLRLGGELGRHAEGALVMAFPSPIRVATIFAAAILALIVGCTHGPSIHARDSAIVDRPLRLYVAQDPPGFNPLITDNTELADLIPLVHGFLLSVDAKGNFTPDLVTEVPSLANGGISRDGRTIRYHLRRGVRWHDGRPFDARDVVFSFRAAMNPDNNVPDRSGFDDVANVRASDAYDVDVTLRRPYSPALATFFSLGANDPYAILPAHLLATLPNINQASYNAHPVGLGPYRIARWDHGSAVELQADPHFRFGAPRIAHVDIRIIPDSNSALTLWQSRQLDYFPVRGFTGNRAFLQSARAVANAREYRSDHYQFDYLMFNVARGALQDARVRRALVMGIDRNRIEELIRGELHRPGDGDRLPGQFAYDSTIREPSYDRVAAARLLDAAGWRFEGGVREKNGVPLAIEIVGPAGLSGAERLDVQIQAALQALGIRATIKDYQYNVLFGSAQTGGTFASGRFDLTSYGWQPGEDADHSYLFRCDTRPPNGENYGRVCDPVIDREANVEIESSNSGTQIAADRAMLREIDAKSYVDFLGFDREILFATSDLAGIEPSVLGHHFWNLYRWHWER